MRYLTDHSKKLVITAEMCLMASCSLDALLNCTFYFRDNYRELVKAHASQCYYYEIRFHLELRTSLSHIFREQEHYHTSQYTTMEAKPKKGVLTQLV